MHAITPDYQLYLVGHLNNPLKLKYKWSEEGSKSN